MDVNDEIVGISTSMAHIEVLARMGCIHNLMPINIFDVTEYSCDKITG